MRPVARLLLSLVVSTGLFALVAGSLVVATAAPADQGSPELSLTREVPSDGAAATAALPHADLLGNPAGCAACHLPPSEPGATVGPADPRACVNCHIGSDGAAPGVYAGDPRHYDVPDGFGHNDPAQITCISCHAIHGPVVQNAALVGKLLKVLDYQPEAIAECDPETAPHDQALSVWCTGCHPLWPDLTSPSTDSPWVTASHPFAAADDDTAWRDCLSCFDCHAASGGFPHYTPGADAGLVGAASAEAEREGVASRSVDGVCLACHRSEAGPNVRGVGIDY